MRWKEIITLLPANRKIFANMESVGRTEFYAALSAGETVDLLFTVRDIDYDGSHDLIYDGSIYKVLRSYRKTDDFTVLTCQRRERSPIFHEWELTDSVELWDLITTETAIGEKQTPSMIATIAAKVETTSGRGYEEERRNKAELSHKVTIAYRADVEKGMYFKWKNRKLDIEYIVDLDGAGVMLECYCAEEQKNG